MWAPDSEKVVNPDLRSVFKILLLFGVTVDLDLLSLLPRKEPVSEQTKFAADVASSTISNFQEKF